jgi:hypothetical protein
VTRGREIAVVVVALALVAVATFWPVLGETGFYNDDYSYANGSVLAPSFWDAVRVHDYLSFRPLMMLYWPLAFRGLGTGPGTHQALLIGLAVLESALVYALARRFEVKRAHAALVALLVLLSPAADSTRFWPAMSANVLAVCAWLGGLLVALAGLRREGWRGRAMHACALVLYLGSVLLYEIAASLILASGAAYVWVKGRRGLPRWAADVGVTALALVLFTRRTFYEPLPVSELPAHATLVAREAANRFVDGFWAPSDPSFAVVAAVALAAVALLATGWRAGLRGHVSLCLVAAAASTIALVMVVPSADLSPGRPGQHNRGNLTAAIGFAALAYGLIVLAVELAGRRRRGTTAVAVALGLVVALGSAIQLRRDADDWANAAAAQERVLDAVGRPPTGSTVFTVRAPIVAAPDVPVFAAVWDLRGALALRYSDATLRAYPILPGSRLECGRSGVAMRNSNDVFERQAARYTDAIFVDVAGRRRLEPTGASACREAARLATP